MPGVRTSSSVSQKIQEREINARVVLQPHTWYTCPTGKVAKVKGSVQCTGRGAAATASFEVAGIIMFTWTSSATPQGFETSPRLLSSAHSEFALFEVELSAGEIIETTQNTGTNAEFNVFATVVETDV